MKITFIIQDLFCLGAQYVTALMVRGFVAKGYDVDLIVSKVHQDLLDEGRLVPFDVPASTHWIILHDRKARNNIREIRRYLKTSDTYAVIAMSSNYTEALSLAALGLWHRPKIFTVEHSSGVGMTRGGYGFAPTPSWFRVAHLHEMVINHSYDRLLAVSTGTADAMARMMHYPRNKISVVYNPIIDDLFYKKIQYPATHPWLLKKEMPTFVIAGSHTGYKNHLMAFEAIRSANESHPVRLILFGGENVFTPSYHAFVEKHHLEDRISIAGFCNNLPAEMKASDGVLLSSLVESFSVVIVEALACHVPVIATDCPYGPGEILQRGKFGALVPVNDASAMAEAILKVVHGQGIIAPDEAWKCYETASIVNRYEKALGLGV